MIFSSILCYLRHLFIVDFLTKVKHFFVKKDPEPLWSRVFLNYGLLNLHIDFLDQGKPVWFSFSQFHLGEIKRLIVFTWRRSEWFAVELFFDDFYSDRVPFIPDGLSAENSPVEWVDVPEKCWAHLTGYRELDMEDLKKLTSTLTKEPLSEKIKQRAFRSVEFGL